jgi:iron(III) transport system substrate-binding protein
MRLTKLLAAGLAGAIAMPSLAAEVNVYSARQDALIAPLLERFEETSGVKVNLITGKAEELLTRIKAEGAATPADLLITVDAGNLHRAKEAGVLQPIKSALVESRVPEKLIDPGKEWVGLTLRARPIFYAKDRVDTSKLSTYEALTDAHWKGRICIRSSGNIYNQSLVASMIEVNGEAATEEWARGMVANFARKPTGGDTDQLRAVAAGQCDIAVSNTYYYGRLLDSKKPEDRTVTQALGVFWPNQDDRGVHVNISGAGYVKHAKNPEQAIQLLEFMVSDEAQAYYAEINHEYPVVDSATLSQTIESLGTFEADELNLSVLGTNNTRAVKVMDRADWQ